MAKLPDWLDRELREALSKPTMTIPTAGKLLGVTSRGGAYNLAQQGIIPTISMGKLRPVPTIWVRRQLQLDD